MEPAQGAEGGHHEEDHQAEDQRHPVRDNHYWRIRSVYALPGDQRSYFYILILQTRDIIGFIFQDAVPHLILVNLG